MGELRPQVLDALGLAGALRDEVELFGRVTGIEAGFSSAMPARVSPETELVLWRTSGLILGALRRQAAAGGTWTSRSSPGGGVAIEVLGPSPLTA